MVAVGDASTKTGILFQSKTQIIVNMSENGFPPKCISGGGGATIDNKDEIERKKLQIKDTLCCPHCDMPLQKWKVPQTLFTQWPNEYFYICFNDDCPYFLKGWEAMAAQGRHCSYRLMYDDMTDTCQPAPVPNRDVMRDGIIEQDTNI